MKKYQNRYPYNGLYHIYYILPYTLDLFHYQYSEYSTIWCQIQSQAFPSPYSYHGQPHTLVGIHIYNINLFDFLDGVPQIHQPVIEIMFSQL